jgi:Xaa-Pro aminopeptidase
MKSDLNELMRRENLAALWVMGGASGNPDMHYFTGHVHVGDADLILPAGKAPVIFCNAMEREEAASSGLETIIVSKYNFQELLEKTGGDVLMAQALEHQLMFQELGVTAGRVAVSGKTDLGPAMGMIKHLAELLPDLEFVGEGNRCVLLEARATKDDNEIAHIKEMGRITTLVVGMVADYLQNCRIREDEVLLDEGDKALTIGAVKSKINLWLAGYGLENPEDCILTIGRDAGIPHNAGNPKDEVRLGKTIIFDIYPQEGGGGYFYDFTRTWCLGYAPPQEEKIYRDVLEVYQDIMGELEMDGLASHYQDRTCELFEALGHRTIRQDSQLLSGYTHSLGHGLGLYVHERPSFYSGSGQQDRLSPGSVVTIEPGLYYPDQGMGCRIEDSVWVKPDGKMEILADYPYDLVLPMKNWQT